MKAMIKKTTSLLMVASVSQAVSVDVMDELNDLMEMTVALAQVSSESVSANNHLPWFSILEQQQEVSAPATGLAALLGKGDQ